MKPKIRHPKISSRQNPELNRLADAVAGFIGYWGFKEVQGRLWCYLFVSSTPLSSIQLSQLLGISPALVTQSVQVLLEYQVIVAVEKGPNGVMRYAANPSVATAVAGVLKRREAVMLATVGKSAERAVRENSDLTRKKTESKSNYKVNGEKLALIQGWSALAQLFLDSAIKQLDQASNPFESPEKFMQL